MYPVNPTLFAEPAERALYETLLQHQDLIDQAYEHGDYHQALTRLASFKTPIDHFFDHVMVMTDDTTLQHNRLALLSTLHRLLNQVADLAKLPS